jgi:hypothetical protein
MIDKVSGEKSEDTTKHTHITVSRKDKFSEISNFAVYLRRTYLFSRVPQFSEIASLTEKRFCVIEDAEKETMHQCPEAFRKRLREDPPPRMSTQTWCGYFELN